MNKVILTNAFISKGYKDAKAINFYGDNDEVVRFRIGKSVYDKNAENNTRWLNFNVKGFKDVAEKAKKLKLKEGYCINIVGSLDEDSWKDTETGETKKTTVIILSEIEYANSGSGNSEKKETSSEKNDGKDKAKKEPTESENFKGYEEFDAKTFFGE